MAKELTSITDPTGEVGDTHDGFVIRTRYAPGVFAWDPIPIEELVEDIVEEEIQEADEETDNHAIVRDILIF